MKLTRKKKHHIDFEYQLEGSKLEFVDNIKYLGVHIGNDLRWNKHVHEVTNKANTNLIPHFRPQEPSLSISFCNILQSSVESIIL
jgi:hypothetical protein